MVVYNRTYTEDEIISLKGRELKSYNRKRADFGQALGKLTAERREKERKRNDAIAVKKSTLARKDGSRRNDALNAIRQESSANNTAQSRTSTDIDADAKNGRKSSQGPGDRSSSREKGAQQQQQPTTAKNINHGSKAAAASESRGRLKKRKSRATTGNHSGDGSDAAAVEEGSKEKDKGASSDGAGTEQPANSSLSPLRKWFSFGGK